MKHKLCKLGDVITLNNKHRLIVVRMTAKDEDGCGSECYFCDLDEHCERSLKKLIPDLALYVKACDWRQTCFLPWGLCFKKLEGGV